MIANKEGGARRRIAAGLAGLSLHHPHRDAYGRDGVAAAMGASQQWFLDTQHSDGHWVGELEGDSILESEYVLLMAFLGREGEEVCVKACKYLHEQQRDEGGWAIYPGGPFDLGASVKAYFALKLAGMHVDHPSMVKARELILAAGGASLCNSFSRFYLALLGQISYDDCPSVPPEILLVPPKLNFSLYAMSAWSRPILVPLSIISALKPVRKLPEKLGIAELFLPGEPKSPRFKAPLLSWRRTFLTIDKMLKWGERNLPTTFRKRGLKAAHRWMLEHFENSDGLGAIFPPMIYAVVALRALGYEANDPLVQWAMEQLDDLLIEENGSVRVQPCVSPVWDTAIATIALADSGLPDFHPALLRSARWLLDKEVRTTGDLRLRRPEIPSGGWHFQYRNELYPDVDDTAMVLIALSRTSLSESTDVQATMQRGVDWLLAMQNKDGGWAAFDPDIDNQVLTQVPFADHNAMLDPSCADITARVVELLGGLGYSADHPAVKRGLNYLWKTQEPDGCWYGRWGVNYIYGTWQVLVGLRAIGFDMNDPRVVRAADWLVSVQQSDGGWGESCRSYEDPAWKGRGTPTASQTAWAVMGLIAAGRATSEAVRRGVDFLRETQKTDGTWDEPEFTGTGFPLVFYLKYHLYRVYFPLMALARYQMAAAAVQVANPGTLASRVPALPLFHDF
jgi:squalene-hopene/tetraprenyl-beta-curcumene cyclase